MIMKLSYRNPCCRSKVKTQDMYLDHATLELKKSFFSLSPVIKTGTHFELMLGTKPKHRLELSHVDSDAVSCYVGFLLKFLLSRSSIFKYRF